MKVNENKYEQLRQSVLAAYLRKTVKSKEMYDRASKSLAGGVSGHLRLFEPYPMYMTHGRGSKTYDVDGNEYIDCFLCAGALLLGHCHESIMSAVEKERRRGVLVYNPDLAVECAELLQEIVPCAEKVRFANSGTEAIMIAARIARAFTKKRKIIKFYGHYHGQDDQFLIGISNNEEGPVSLGQNEGSWENTVLLPFNNMSAVEEALEGDRDIAAVILEPQMNMGGLFPGGHDFVKGLRALTERFGVVLIFDEVITGFRVALGGAQEYYGVKPDLAVFSKSVAGGAKFSAVVGRESIMSTLLGTGARVFHSGTYNDGTESLASAIGALRAYVDLNQKGKYRELHAFGARLKNGIEDRFKARGIPCHVNQLGPSLKIFLTESDPNFDVYSKLDKRFLYLFFIAMINEGIVLSWPSSGSIFLSFSHSERDVREIVDAAERALEKHKFENFMG